MASEVRNSCFTVTLATISAHAHMSKYKFQCACPVTYVYSIYQNLNLHHKCVARGSLRSPTTDVYQYHGQPTCKALYCIFQVGCPRLLEMGGVICLYKPTTTLQPGFVWCTLSHRLFPKAMDNQPEKYSRSSGSLVQREV